MVIASLNAALVNPFVPSSLEESGLELPLSLLLSSSPLMVGTAVAVSLTVAIALTADAGADFPAFLAALEGASQLGSFFILCFAAGACY